MFAIVNYKKLNNSELKNKSFLGVTWNIIGKLSTQIVTFIVSIFLARLLSLSDFGLVAMAMVFISVSQAFMDFGLTTALIQKKSPSVVQINTTFYINLILAVVLTVLMISCSGLIGCFYKNDEIGEIIRVVSLLFIVYAATGVQRAMLTKQLKIKTLTISNLVGAFVQGALGIWLAFNDYGAWSLVYSNIAGSLVTCVMLWLQSSWRPRLMFQLSEIKELFNFGYKLFFSKLLDSIYVKLDELIIGRLFNSDTLGAYSRSKSFNHMIVSYTSDSLGGVFFPVISHIQNDVEQIKRVVVKSLETISFLVFLLIALLYLDAESLIVILFGEKWLVSVEYFKILAFMAYGFPVSAILVNTLLGMGHSGKFLKLEIWKKVIGLSGMFVGFLWGIYGYLWATVVTTAIGVTFNMFFVSKVIPLKISEQWKILIKYALISLGCVIPVWLLNQVLPHNLWLILIVDTLLFSVLYIIVNLSIKTNGFLLLKNIIISKNIGTRLFKFKKGK